MRLVCPNCSAQYEIDGSMIPDEGRDVQCSNCGHTWFELPGPGASVTEARPSEAYGGYGEPEIEDEFEPEADEATEDRERQRSRPENLSREAFEADDDFGAAETPDAGDEEDEDDRYGSSEALRAVTAAGAAAHEEDEPEAPAKPTPRRPADAAALDILREEAERELSQRRAPPSENIETQTELGLDTIRERKTPSRALRARMAHLGEEMPEEATKPQKAARSPARREDDDDSAYEEPRRDLLPDIEEINSTLKPANRRGDYEEKDDSRRRSGFRAGFLLVLLVAIGIIFIYAQAPAIARALPDAEPALIGFVDAANAVRDWIDGMITG